MTRHITVPEPGTARFRSRTRSGGLVMLVAALALSGCAPSGTLDGAVRSSSSASASQAASLEVPLYWQGTNGKKSYLFRTFSGLQPQDGVSSGDVVGQAVAMLAREHPKNPSYRSPWNPAERAGSSMTKNGEIILDLPSGMFRRDLSEDEAKLALQELIFTATGTAAAAGMPNAKATTPVKILVDGQPGYQFAGTDISESHTRTLSAQAPLWIVDPAYGTETRREVVFKMVASNVASTVHWAVRHDGKDIRTGEVSMRDGETGSQEIQFSQRLDPGEYEVVISAKNKDVRDRSLVEQNSGSDIRDAQKFTVGDQS